MSDHEIDSIWREIQAAKHRHLNIVARLRSILVLLRRDLKFAAWWIGVPVVLAGLATWVVRRDVNYVVFTCWIFAGISAVLMLLLGILKFFWSWFSPGVQFKGTIIVGLATAVFLLVPLFIGLQGIGRRGW